MSKFFKLSPDAVRASLKAHSGLGLFIAALLYLVCITGVISVFYPDIERWEQANISEPKNYDPAIVQKALENLLAWHKHTNPHAKTFEDVWVTLPTVEMPRFSVGGQIPPIEAQFFVNADGSLGEKVDHEWTHFIVKLHYALTIPGIWGMVLVGIIGMILVSMVISGIAAHPTIFKNAFSLRVNRGFRQQQIDLHNRIGVWSTPFILAIAITGALIGLSQILLVAFASTFYKGDTTAITNALYMPHPEPTNVAAPFMNVAPVLEKFSQEHTALLPYYFSIHFPETTAQTLEIGAYLPDRLVWYEAFQFNSQGEQIKRLGWSDGDVGTQIYASTYRLHFGHFGGLPIKILYALLGLGMGYLCVTGMNIWFRRQQQAGNLYPKLERSWVAVVWGFPVAIATSLLVDNWWSTQLIAVFWSSSLIIFIFALLIQDHQKISIMLRSLLAGLLTLVLIIHLNKFGGDAVSGASLLVNILLVITVVLLGLGLKASYSLSKEQKNAVTDVSPMTD
ncbi:MAG TPA: PepSY-associated TM helix domain-containing protein [Cellvibrio sp.]|nr:PepSY-associated TM helix domain-containing protein [Cellvibrio sp.]